MTQPQELQHLTRWCAARQLLWQPSRTEAGLPAILLRPQHRLRPWQDVLLVHDDDGVMLIDETGTLLASASEIPALLDAVDSGIAAIRNPLSWGGPEYLPRYAAVGSDIIWNRFGVGIT
jgi:hypothetical protein